MAICFVKSRYVSRSKGGNACRSSAYNARIKIIDEKTGEVFDFSDKEDLAYHEVLLPGYVNKKFSDVTYLSNSVEHIENQKNSQLYIEWVLALPKEEEITLEMKKELVLRFVEYKGWVNEGLGVQINIHAPHEDSLDGSSGKAGDKDLTEEELEQKELNSNWHAHLLFTTRRFRKDGEGFERLKARDLQPEVRHGKVVEETEDNIAWSNIQNEYFKEHGLDLRVDLPGKITQKHIGPVRMRNPLNWRIEYNEKVAEINANSLENGRDVLDMVIATRSVFNKEDLARAVKILPDKETREALMDEAMACVEVVTLYDKNGEKSGFYTTKEVRDEEQRLLRLSGYVANGENIFNKVNSKSIVNNSFNIRKNGLTEEQEEALGQILKNDCGIRVLRGRAGAGKSQVLGRLARIANDIGVNVIGLAPTHKAKLELQSRGYEEVDTIKGMLFKYRNGRAFIPKGSVLVVDEAGMVGNDDYTELLKLAANRKCNVILAGDERQLASIGRGGMFEVFAEEYGSSLICDIQRQKDKWAKSVAMALSNGHVRSAISVLGEQGKIVRSTNAEESIKALIQDWAKSDEKLENKLIIAVKNADVELINEAAREHLRGQGWISSAGVRIGGKTYAKGDRIIIKETSKDLGLVNGDFGKIERIGTEICVIRLDGEGSKGAEEQRKIEFDPTKYQGFRHGYATTIYKAQGASISEVYVHHNSYSGLRNAYVALSRSINDMKLYINDGFTKSTEHLIKQLGANADIGSSLSYMIKEECERAKEDELRGNNMLRWIGKWVRAKTTELGDKWSNNSEYYEYKAPLIVHSKVEEVLEQVAIASRILEANGEVRQNTEEVAIAIGEQNIRIKNVGMGRVENKIGGSVDNKRVATNKPTKKERFYDQVQRSRGSKEKKEERDYKQELAALKGAIQHNCDRIARDLLGEPNNKLSRVNIYRYGGKGSLAVHIRGAKVGTWYDFEAGKGGDIFALVQRERGGEFKDAAQYLKDMFKISKAVTLKLVHDNELEEKYARHVKAKEQQEKEEALKAKAVEKLYVRAKDIKETSIANRYLREVRNIQLDTPLGADIKTAGIYHKIEGEELGERPEAKGKYLPALVAFARDKDGKVTGGQQILLDKKSGEKAKIELPKRSFGKIAGSFVEVGHITSSKQTEKSENITMIAEGVETALSIRQAFEKQELNVKVLCSLGVSNIRNYPAKVGEKIIIAADNDGENAISTKTIENAKKELEEKGSFVEITKPQEHGDFNDLLKEHGVEKIRGRLKRQIAMHQAKTVESYLKAKGETSIETALDKQAITDLKYLEKYGIDQEQIVDRFRKSNLAGTIELDNTRKEVMIAEDFVENKGKAILDEVQAFGGKIRREEIIKAITSKTAEERLEHLQIVRDKCYMEIKTTEIANEKENAKTVKQLVEVIVKEQDFYNKLGNNLKSKYPDEQTSELIKQANLNEQNKTLDKLQKIVGIHIDKGISKPEDVANILKNSESPKGVQAACQSLIKSYQSHTIKELQKCLDGIHAGKIVSMDGKKFDCQTKFLEHVLESHKANEFLPRQTIEKAHTKLIEHHLEKDFSMGL